MNDPASIGPDAETVRIANLYVHPIKSCAGIALDEALLIETGVELDRAWMVVDAAGTMVTQRDLPRMALIRPQLRTEEMVLRAPGMLALHVALDRVEAPTRATVWHDEIAAFDMGDLCAQWLTDFLGRPMRLLRFDPAQKRLADKRWTGAIDAETALTDGYPLLVISSASLAELNRRLGVHGTAAVTMARFRPNIVLEGLDAHGEDALDEIVFATDDGPVRLKLVVPCSRCSIPDIDPLTAATGHAVGDTLLTYRTDSRLAGAITFGMNAVIVEGIERALRVGMAGHASFAFA